MPKRGFPLKWLMAGLIIGAAAYYVPGVLRGEKSADTAENAAGAPVSIAAVIHRPVIAWNEFSGILQAVHAVEIRPRVSGQITAIHFVDGAQVKKGDALITIDPRPYEAALLSAKGAYRQAKASFDRAQKLIKSKAISSAELEQTQSAYEQAFGQYQAAQLNLGYTHILAPLSGKISRAEITTGNQVEAGASAPLLASIVALSPIYASFDMDEATYLTRIQSVPAGKLPQIPVEVRLGHGGGAALKARIHSVDNQLTPGSGTIRVRAVLDNASGSLLPGLFAQVRLGSADAADAILINPTAVGTDQSKKFVMVVGEGSKAEYREVTLGSVVDGLQMVTAGLKAGEQIIVDGLQRVRPGAPIQGAPVDMQTLKPLSPPESPAAPSNQEKP